MPELGNKIVTNYLRDYYKSSHGLSPDKIEQREFGFGSFENRIAVRHTEFKSETNLHNYLVDTAPLHVDYSAAYYQHPAMTPMEKKGWLGSELRFDIDAGDIVKLPCRIDHGKEWVCDKCLEAAKEEVIKLIEKFLVPDFGFLEKEAEINFSGNRGYHIHIKRESILMLDKNAREELSNYLFGQGQSVDALFYTVPVDSRHRKQMGPKPTDGGWGGKIARAFIESTNSKEDLTSLGIEKTTASWIFRNMTKVKEQIALGNWDFISIPKKEDVFSNLLNKQVINQGNRIDKGVTNDPMHLMRLPESIHGGTGLIAKKIPSLAALKIFNPMIGAIAFKSGELKVRANSKYRLVMNGQEFGPYKSEIVTLPAYAAIYLYLKGAADMLIGS
jgi:DNA primase small subunit